jgi:hypothetical protein
VTKNEFTQWVIQFVTLAPTAVPHTEVTLQDMVVQFGLEPIAVKSISEQVLDEMEVNNRTLGSEDTAATEEDVTSSGEPTANKNTNDSVYSTEEFEDLQPGAGLHDANNLEINVEHHDEQADELIKLTDEVPPQEYPPLEYADEFQSEESQQGDLVEAPALKVNLVNQLHRLDLLD